MTSSRKTELIVGLFVLFAFGVLMTMSFLIKGGTGPGSYVFEMEYTDVSGLDIGSPVLVSGFRTGQVIGMRSVLGEDGKPRVVVTARASRRIPIFQDARAVMNQQGFIGDKQIEVTPGSPAAGEISRNQMIQAAPFSVLTQFLPGGEESFEDFQAIIRNIRDITGNQERLENIDRVIVNLARAMEELTATVEENRDALRATLANIERVSERGIEVAENADVFLRNANERLLELSSEIQRTNALVQERLTAISDRADSIGENADLMIAEGRAELQRLSENLLTTSANINRLMEEVNEGDGTLGLLLRDPKPFNDLRDSIAALRAALLNEQEAFYDRSLPYNRPSGDGVR